MNYLMIDSRVLNVVAKRQLASGLWKVKRAWCIFNEWKCFESQKRKIQRGGKETEDCKKQKEKCKFVEKSEISRGEKRKISQHIDTLNANFVMRAAAFAAKNYTEQN